MFVYLADTRALLGLDVSTRSRARYRFSRNKFALNRPRFKMILSGPLVIDAVTVGRFAIKRYAHLKVNWNISTVSKSYWQLSGGTGRKCAIHCCKDFIELGRGCDGVLLIYRLFYFLLLGHILSASVDSVYLHVYRLRFTRDSCWSWCWFHRLSKGLVISYPEDHQGVWSRPENYHRFGIFIKFVLQEFVDLKSPLNNDLSIGGRFPPKFWFLGLKE